MELVRKYPAIITDQPGTTKLEEHVIEVTNAASVGAKPYIMLYAKISAVKEEVQKMLDAGIIEISCLLTIQWKLRYCIDYRKLNAITKFVIEPMEVPEDILANLQGDQFFTKLDLSNGYWQLLYK